MIGWKSNSIAIQIRNRDLWNLQSIMQNSSNLFTNRFKTQRISRNIYGSIWYIMHNVMYEHCIQTNTNLQYLSNHILYVIYVLETTKISFCEKLPCFTNGWRQVRLYAVTELFTLSGKQVGNTFDNIAYIRDYIVM